jgi:hypothetical protein
VVVAYKQMQLMLKCNIVTFYTRIPRYIFSVEMKEGTIIISHNFMYLLEVRQVSSSFRNNNLKPYRRESSIQSCFLSVSTAVRENGTPKSTRVVDLDR